MLWQTWVFIKNKTKCLFFITFPASVERNEKQGGNKMNPVNTFVLGENRRLWRKTWPKTRGNCACHYYLYAKQVFVFVSIRHVTGRGRENSLSSSVHSISQDMLQCTSMKVQGDGWTDEQTEKERDLLQDVNRFCPKAWSSMHSRV